MRSVVYNWALEGNITHGLLRVSVLGLMLVAGGCSSAGAGGLYLNEFATPSMGVAGAGQKEVLKFLRQLSRSSALVQR